MCYLNLKTTQKKTRKKLFVLAGGLDQIWQRWVQYIDTGWKNFTCLGRESYSSRMSQTCLRNIYTAVCVCVCESMTAGLTLTLTLQNYINTWHHLASGGYNLFYVIRHICNHGIFNIIIIGGKEENYFGLSWCNGRTGHSVQIGWVWLGIIFLLYLLFLLKINKIL